MLEDLTPEQTHWREDCRRFAAEVMLPLRDQYDRSNAFPEAVHREAYERGLMNVGFPEALGGRSLSHATLAVGGEELAAVCAPTAFTMAFNHGSLRPILEAGTEEQKQRFVKELLARRGYASLCFTEAERSGSNLMDVATRAVRTDGGWTLTGTKAMVGNGTVAELFLVLADAVVDGRRRGLTLLAVPEGPGVRVGPNTDKVGFRCLPTPTVEFDAVEVPEDHLVGGVGDAEQVLIRTLHYMRFGGAVVSLGMVVGALRDVLPWLEERRVFGGETLIAKSHVQLELGEIYTGLAAARLMLGRVATLLDEGRHCSSEMTMAKLLSTRLAQRATDSVIQLLGWRGVDGDHPFQKRYRDARVTTIYEGTSEILLLQMCRELRRDMRTE